jgi:hypothetical protein
MPDKYARRRAERDIERCLVRSRKNQRWLGAAAIALGIGVGSVTTTQENGSTNVGNLSSGGVVLVATAAVVDRALSKRKAHGIIDEYEVLREEEGPIGQRYARTILVPDANGVREVKNQDVSAVDGVYDLRVFTNAFRPALYFGGSSVVAASLEGNIGNNSEAVSLIFSCSLLLGGYVCGRASQDNDRLSTIYHRQLDNIDNLVF